MPTALDSVFQNIANAIRSKTGKSATITPGNMANEINSISLWRGDYIAYTDLEEDMFSGGPCISDPLFNKPVTIGSKVTSCGNLFRDCTNFNQSVTIPNSVTNCTNMLSGCTNFNQSVTIPNSVVLCGYMFFNCRNLNQLVTISNSATNSEYMFYNCINFNQSVTIPNSVTNCIDMFYNCTNFNQPIIIPNSVTNCNYMFFNCKQMNCDIKLLHTTQSIGVSNMLRSANNSKRKNIYCANLSLLNATDTKSLVGAAITWSSTTNGYYNIAYNIYILNNI